MPKWDLQAREHTPAGTEVKRARADSRLLTPGEVRFERLRLAWDMVTLVLTDGEGLPPDVRLELGAVREVLTAAWRATRSLP
jgi:hypothetical protein